MFPFWIFVFIFIDLLLTLEYKIVQMRYFNTAIETLQLDKLRAIQNERLQQTVQNLYHNVAFYRQLFDSNNLKPNDIRTVEDLHKIPFTYKSALRDEYPFGLFAKPQSELQRLHCSSGTTGKPIVVGYTAGDIEIFSEVVARSLVAAGCQPGMLLQNAYGYGLFTGGLGIHYGAEKLGMCVLPISGGGTDKQIMLMKDFQTDVICATPSYASTLAEELQRRAIDFNELNLKHAILGAEPWTETTRKQIEKGLGVDATNIYGLSEIIGPGVAQEDYEEKGSGSYIWEDHFFPEIVDKDTGEPLPYGQKGVLVFTTLTKQAAPLLRYYTNDIASLYYDKSAKRTHIKMSNIEGRADDMLIIRGVNLFPSQVEATLQYFDRLSNNFQLVVSRSGAMDEVLVEVELENAFFEALIKETSNPLEHHLVKAEVVALQKKIKADIGLSMKVTACIPHTIKRSEGGKTARINDLRKI